MQPVFIEAGEDNSEIIDYLENEFKKYDSIKKNYSINLADKNGTISIICTDSSSSSDDKAAKLSKIFRLYLSNALADFIMHKYEETLILKIINNNYPYFASEEKKEVIKRALSNVKNEDRSFINGVYRIKRRNMIIRKLIDFLDNSDSIILDGFVTFRLKDYIIDLEDIVEKTVDSYLVDREYREFVKLLKYFVEVQEPRYDEVNIFVDNKDRYVIIDKEGRDITKQCMEEFRYEGLIGKISQDDLLISALISNAPKKIIIHNPENFRNKELLNTIKNVFCSRVLLR